MAQHEGWCFEQTEFINCVRSPSGQTEVSIDGDSLQIEVEQGHGWLSQQTSAYVPIEVIERLLLHAGYRMVRIVDETSANV